MFPGLNCCFKVNRNMLFYIQRLDIKLLIPLGKCCFIYFCQCDKLKAVKKEIFKRT